MHKAKAFTIVELLVVIIVIAILVTLSIVGYAGISSKATVSAIQSDLSNAKKQLLAYQAQSTSSSFPTAINCSSPGATEICIRTSSSSYTLSYTPLTSGFYLNETDGNVNYFITESSAPTTTQSLVTSGIEMYLDASNSSSYPGTGTTWYDLSGNSRNGTMTSVTYSNTLGGNLVFNGTSSKVAFTGLSNVKMYNSTVTFAVSLPVVSGGQRVIVSSRGGAGGNLYIGKNNAQLFSYYDNFPSPAFVGGAISENQVFIATIVCDATNGVFRHYVNGILTATSNVKTGWVSSPINLLNIGYDAGGTNEYFLGSFYFYAHYNRILSASEIYQNFNALRGRYGI